MLNNKFLHRVIFLLWVMPLVSSDTQQELISRKRALSCNDSDLMVDVKKIKIDHQDQSRELDTIVCDSNQNTFDQKINIVDFFTIDPGISNEIWSFLDHNIHHKKSECYIPSYIKKEHSLITHASKSGNFTQFIYAWQMLHFYRSQWDQFQKYRLDYPLHRALRIRPVYENVAMQALSHNGYRCIIRRLLQEKSFINQQDHHQVVPLHLASRLGDVYLVKQLAKYGADMNAQDHEGNTAFHYAILGKSSLNNKKEVIQALYFLGANINLKNNKRYEIRDKVYYGVTPLVYATGMQSDYDSCLLVGMMKNLGAIQ